VSLQPASTRVLDPLQSVLAHLGPGMYGTYEGLCMHLWHSPTVPTRVKEGLRFLSAVSIGCSYCITVRERDTAGERLLSDDFYARVGQGERAWAELVEAPWHVVFAMAEEVLADRPVSADTLRRSSEEGLIDGQIVEAIFFLLLIGASHRFSVAFGVEAACALPTRLQPSGDAVT
jgi:alkylhydroperoxidase family enzyme